MFCDSWPYAVLALIFVAYCMIGGIAANNSPLRRENARLRRALDLSGIPAQAKLDDKAPPLKTTVAGAREVMEVVNGNA